MPRISANGLDLSYRIDGDGPETLVLVNGLADNKESWEAQIPAFSERYRVISFDNRGIGESPTPPGPYTTTQMAEDLAGLVDALEVDRFHLLGVSMGGMIAQEYAIAHTHRLLSASFCCTYSYPGPFCLRMFQCWRDLVPTLGVGFTQREVILWAFTTDFFEQHEDVLIEIENLMANNPQPSEAYLAQLNSIEQHDTRGRLSAVRCPALTLVAEGDLIIYPKLSRRLHDELPNSTWAVTPGGHACLWEYPDAFNSSVLSFLDGVDVRS
jgi:3-oxoadipate enol-lactonase